MVDQGSQPETVTASQATLTIGGDRFLLKQNFNLTVDLPFEDDGYANGTTSIRIHQFAVQRNFLDAEIEVSTPDIATFIDSDGTTALTTRDANGDLPLTVYVITLPPVGGGATVTMTFSGKMNHAEITSVSLIAKVTLRIQVAITTDVDVA